MSVLSTRTLASVAAVLLAASAQAQGLPRLAADQSRVLADITDRIKGDDGVPTIRRMTLTYDPVSGAYVETVRDGSGALLARTVAPWSNVGPTAAEDAEAKALVAADAEVATLRARSLRSTLVTGGFPLLREAGHACGPGSRCLQYDVLETGGRAPVRRLRFVVVDLRTLSIVSNDFDPAAEGNLAHPETRRQSRSAQR